MVLLSPELQLGIKGNPATIGALAQIMGAEAPSLVYNLYSTG